LGDVFLLALLAALNPTLVAASTVMMLLPNPIRLMLGYLLGALMTSITLGLVIVFSLEGSGGSTSTDQALSSTALIALGVIALIAAFVIGTGRGLHAAEHHHGHTTPKKEKGPPRWQQALARGSARVTFVVGALLTLPGGAYLTGLSRIDKLNYSTGATVVVVLAFNLIMLSLLEVPLVCFTVAPDWTPQAVQRAQAWVRRHARRFAATALTVLGVLLTGTGVVELLV
jgi:Sap-like sulfolipid-1-addressing protein